jgi:hypothetical protein
LLFKNSYDKTQTMGEDTPPPQEPNSQELDSQETLSSDQPNRGFFRGFLRGRTRKVLATAAVVGVAGGAAAGIGTETGKSPRPELRTDVPYQKYGQDGHPAPQAIMQKSHDQGIDKIITVRSDNPFELAQQDLYLAAKEETMNRLAYGLKIVVRPGTTFYHSLPGSSTFMPANQSNNGQEGKFVVPSDEVAIIENPRFIVNSVNDEPNEPVYIAATLAGDTTTTNRATDINQVYFISVPDVYKQLYKEKEGFLSLNGSPVPLAEAAVDQEGNLRLGNGTVPTNQLSIIKTVEQDSFDKLKNDQRLSPTIPTAGR